MNGGFSRWDRGVENAKVQPDFRVVAQPALEKLLHTWCALILQHFDAETLPAGVECTRNQEDPNGRTKCRALSPDFRGCLEPQESQCYRLSDIRQLQSPRRQFPHCQRNRWLQTIC